MTNPDSKSISRNANHQTQAKKTAAATKASKSRDAAVGKCAANVLVKTHKKNTCGLGNCKT
eukprot:3930753-Pyramimonas_sp.AAC.1